MSDPELLLPIALLATTMALLFIMGLLLYRVFKVELVLLFRTVFPFFYASTGTQNTRKPVFPLWWFEHLCEERAKITQNSFLSKPQIPGSNKLNK